MEEEGASSETIWRSSCQRAPAQWPNRAGAHIDESDPGQMGRQWKSPASTRQCITGTQRMAVSTVDHWDAWQGSKMVPSTISGQNVYPPGCIRIPFRANKYCMFGFVFILTKLIGRTSDQKLVDWTKHFKSIVVVSSKHGQSIQMLAKAKSSFKVALNNQ